MPELIRDWPATTNGLTIGLHQSVDGGLTWDVSAGATIVSAPAPLHLTTVDGADLLAGLSFLDDHEDTVEESYELVVGKRVGPHRVVHQQRTVRFARPGGGEVEVVLRAATDGVALRIVLDLPVPVRVRGGDAGLRFPADAATWPLTYTPWYETTRFASTLDRLEPGDYGFPLLVEVADGLHTLVTESDLDGRYGGSFARYAGDGAFTVTLADDVDVAGRVATPWRTLVVGDLATIVGSHLVDDLAPAAAARPPAWVRPGRAAWSWWSDFYSGAQLDAQLRMLDYAAARGWEYVLVDCGWDATWMPELVAAASERGVGVFVWVVWDRLATDEQRRSLAQWASWGVAGVKVDFMESEAQERYRWYDAVIAECARVGLMINFHGSVIPRGWARTHPHVVSYEAVRGAEYYVFYSEPLTPEHNTIVAFTRNVVGSADYTPVTFSAKARLTTEAHELALAVVLESGVLNFADEIDEYARRPIAEAAIERIRAHWDETRLLAGRPGEFVALARRSGTEWFVGVISAGGPRSLELDVGALGLPSHGLVATIITDDDEDRLSQTVRRVRAAEPVTLELRRNGGALVMLAPDDAGTERATAPPGRVVVPAQRVIHARPGETIEVAATISGATSSSVGGSIAGNAEPHLVVPPGWPEPHRTPARPAAEPSWQVSLPAGLGPGHLAVLTVHAGDPLGATRAALAHVRVVTPLQLTDVDEPVSLVDIAPIAARNGSGPVERDQSNGAGNPDDGQPMRVGGRPHARGLGVSAPSEVVWALDGSPARFTGAVGVDDESPEGVTATCTVLGDDDELARADVVVGEPAVVLDLDLTGVTRLRLTVTSPADAESAHVDWIDPHVRPYT